MVHKLGQSLHRSLTDNKMIQFESRTYKPSPSSTWVAATPGPTRTYFRLRQNSSVFWISGGLPSVRSPERLIDLTFPVARAEFISWTALCQDPRRSTSAL